MAAGSGIVRINYKKIQKYARELGDDAAKRAADITKARVVRNIRSEDRINTGRMIESIKVEKTYEMNYRVIGRAPYLGLQEHGRKAIVAGTYIRDKNGRRRRKPMYFYWWKAGGNVKLLKVKADPGGHFFADAREMLHLGDFTSG
jgi:hypothetical protein